MCGRFTITVSPEELKADFDLASVPQGMMPRFNIAPSQDVPVVTSQAPDKLVLYRWGLVPSWAKDPAMGNRMINARADTLAQKPAFKTSFKKKRCIVLADGFYEWKAEGAVKIPFYVRLKTRRPFSFAGLWDHWKSSEDEEIYSCTIITTEPNKLLNPIHDRMPVILEREDRAIWLNPKVEDLDRLSKMLLPYPDEDMEAYPVSTLVNSPAIDREECIAPS
ncbi:MAG: SOS response-associated peptidase [Pseudomonadota bacterium]